jgi:hypothetical protein
MAEPDAPEVEAEAAPAKAAKAPKAKKGKADAKGKKAGKGKKGADPGAQLSVASHARASAYVRRAKGWGGLISFILAAVISAKAGVPIATLGGRALLAGAAGYLVAWGCAVAAWRAILLAEMRARIERARASEASNTLQ